VSHKTEAKKQDKDESGVKRLLRWAFRFAVVGFVAGAPLGVVVAVSSIPGCPRMREQARLKPYEQNDFFDDHSSLRHPPQGTVARGSQVLDPEFYYGRKTLPDMRPQSAPEGTAAEERPTAQTPQAPAAQRGQTTQDYVTDLPIEVTRQTFETGREQYGVYCAPCHGEAGYGNGVITHNGYPEPPSFHTERLRGAAAGYIFEVITNGFGQMYSYGARLEPAQRWAVIAYIRALQYSQNAPAEQLGPQDLKRLEEASP
jgi:mono/diheme cytochrome c family protein